MKSVVFMVLWLALTSVGFAQQASVESGAYNLMLKGLLKRDVPEVDPQKASQIQEQVVFIDTRSRGEFEVSHIRNAIWVGYDDFDISRMQGIGKNTKIIAYCSVGARSEKITRQLLALGYSDVSNLYGGVFEWVNQEKALYNEKNETTEKVHAYNKTWGIWLNKGQKVYFPRPE